MDSVQKAPDLIVVSSKLDYEPFKFSGLMKLQRDFFRQDAEPQVERLNRHWLNATKFEGLDLKLEAAQQYEEAQALCGSLKDSVEILVGRESPDWQRLETLNINFGNLIMVNKGQHEIEALERRDGN